MQNPFQNHPGSTRFWTHAVLVWLLAANAAAAAVSVDKIFGDDMVLQREVQVPVSGNGDPGEEITLRFAGQEKSARADAGGRWKIMLAPLQASAQPQSLEIAGKTAHLTLKNVLVGDVWLFAGQSNMAFTLDKVRDAQTEIATAEIPALRLFGLHFFAASEPLKDIQGSWLQCHPATASKFSAVAYLFGRDLQKQTGVPIGLVGSSLSGSYAQVWVSREAQEADPRTRGYVEAFDWLSAHYKISRPPGATGNVYTDAGGKPVDWNEESARFQRWKQACAAARKAKGPLSTDFPAEFETLGRLPSPDAGPMLPAVGFNRVIAPLATFPIKGAIWYQGESHLVPRDYGTILTELIVDWRKHLSQGDFPFLIVGLPNLGKPVAEPVAGDWPVVREQQWQVSQKLPNVFVTVNTDTAHTDNGNLHPTNKQPIGERLALLAAARVYGHKIEAAAPAFGKMTVEGNTVRLPFSPEGSGVRAVPSELPDLPATIPRSPVLGFALAGDDHQWHWAEAKLEGDAVVLSAANVAHPVAVRYNWTNDPIGNLLSKSGLPVAPYRSDDWPE